MVVTFLDKVMNLDTVVNFDASGNRPTLSIHVDISLATNTANWLLKQGADIDNIPRMLGKVAALYYSGKQFTEVGVIEEIIGLKNIYEAGSFADGTYYILIL